MGLLEKWERFKSIPVVGTIYQENRARRVTCPVFRLTLEEFFDALVDLVDIDDLDFGVAASFNFDLVVFDRFPDGDP